MIGTKIHYEEEKISKVSDVSYISDSALLYQIANGTLKKGDPLFEWALIDRIILNDYVVKENGVSREQVTIFASKDEEHALSDVVFGSSGDELQVSREKYHVEVTWECLNVNRLRMI